MLKAHVAPQLCYSEHVDMGSLKRRPQSILQTAGFFMFLYYPCPPKWDPPVWVRLQHAFKAGGCIIEVNFIFFAWLVTARWTAPPTERDQRCLMEEVRVHVCLLFCFLVYCGFTLKLAQDQSNQEQFLEYDFSQRTLADLHWLSWSLNCTSARHTWLIIGRLLCTIRQRSIILLTVRPTLM